MINLLAIAFILAAVSPKSGATIPGWLFAIIIVAIVVFAAIMFMRRKR